MPIGIPRKRRVVGGMNRRVPFGAFHSSSGPSFSPLDLTPAAWYQFNTGITEAGGFVSAWADQSGNSRHLAQSTGTNQPAVSSGIITFDGADNWMKVTGGFTFSQPLTVAMRFNQKTWTAGETLFDGNTGDNARLTQNTGTPRIAMYAGTAFQPFTTDATLDTFVSGLFCFNGASSYAKIGSNVAATGNPGANNAGGFTLSANGTTLGQFCHLAVKEIILVPSAVSGGDITSLMAYLDAI